MRSEKEADLAKVEFGKNLRILRETDNLKQSELAEKLCVSQRKISYWETEQVEPSLEELWNIAEFFDVTIDELIGKDK